MSTYFKIILVCLVIALVSYVDGTTNKAETPAIQNSLQVSESAILELAKSNGFNPSKRIIKAIALASDLYKVDALELTAIGIVETGLGKYAKLRHNKNGTIDRGIFQINTVNESFCVEYNLDSPEGSALCAAKLLARIKSKHSDYLGRYHSKTRNKKEIYEHKLSTVLVTK